MSYSYIARFGASARPLEQLLAGLDRVCADHRFVFQKRATPMINEGGWPTVDLSRPIIDEETLTSLGVASLGEVAKAAREWWGVSLYCVSQSLAQRLGRSDAMEVDFVLFRAGSGKWGLHYIEASRAQQLRLEESDAAAELYALQLALCDELGFQLSIYEDDEPAGGAVPDLKDLKNRLHRCAKGQLGCSMVISKDLMDLAAATKEANGLANRVRLTTQGYVLFPFLAHK